MTLTANQEIGHIDPTIAMLGLTQAMKRHHSMPFGAEMKPEGIVRFRLWAPQSRSVHLCLMSAAGGSEFSMDRREHGWYELVTEDVRPGALYCFKIDNRSLVPDPASRHQPQDVHGPSEVIDPATFDWEDGNWRGRRWEEAVFYELHIGAFTQGGTFAEAEGRLDDLVKLGVTALQVMPVADFPGRRNWGYDGVLMFAPDSSYGRPEDLKHFIQTAHQKNIMVFLDVVYNHFGPDGNYLHLYAPHFFTERHQTPWGAGINFDGPDSKTVREFFIHNALYWIQEYHLDGLRLDAVHAMHDETQPHILEELARSVQQTVGNIRRVHLVLENDHNEARYLARDDQGKPKFYAGQWNDDIHHCLHTLLTAETTGYYADYETAPAWYLGRALAEGFAYQGEQSAYRNGESRGEPSKGLPPTAFVSFLQNHDQIGNRAFGDRIAKLVEARALKAAVAVLLLAPSPPLLFMGEEFGCLQPFLFFCDFEEDLTKSVTEGRRKEFAKFPEFAHPEARQRIPDPNEAGTFMKSVLDRHKINEPRHKAWESYYTALLAIRRRDIVPRIKGIGGGTGTFKTFAEKGLTVSWKLADHARLTLVANFGDDAAEGAPRPRGSILFESSEGVCEACKAAILPPWSVLFCVKD